MIVALSALEFIPFSPPAPSPPQGTHPFSPPAPVPTGVTYPSVHRRPPLPWALGPAALGSLGGWTACRSLQTHQLHLCREKHRVGVRRLSRPTAGRAGCLPQGDLVPPGPAGVSGLRRRSAAPWQRASCLRRALARVGRVHPGIPGPTPAAPPRCVALGKSLNPR